MESIYLFTTIIIVVEKRDFYYVVAFKERGGRIDYFIINKYVDNLNLKTL